MFEHKLSLPIAHVKLPISEENIKPNKKFSDLLLKAASKIGVDTAGLGWHKGIRKKGKIKYDNLSEPQIEAISRKNYEALRWFHGTPDDKNIPSILDKGLSGQNNADTCVSKCHQYSLGYARGEAKRVFRVFLDPKQDRLINYFKDPEEKLACKRGPIERSKLSTQDPATIGQKADELFHREMKHDIPNITHEQSRAALRRYGSFDASQQPKGWKPFNGEWRSYESSDRPCIE